MGRVLKILAWVVSVPLLLVFLFATLGFLAVRYNVWPSRCEFLPFPQAERICAFSRRNAVPRGTSTTLHVWATSSFSNPVFFVMNGGAPIPMKRESNNSFSLSVPVTVGKIYSYTYRQEGVSSTEVRHTYAVRSQDPSLFDVVQEESGSTNTLRASSTLRRVVDMADVWSINYNYNYFENTRNVLDEVMDHAYALNANELDVHTFVEAKGTEDAITLAPIESPLTYLGNASITLSDMKELAKKGRAHGLDVVIHYEIVPRYIQYYNVRDTDITTVGYGHSIAIEKAMNDLGFSDQKSPEWIDMWFDALEPVLVKWARDAETAGIYGIDVTSERFTPRFAPYEKRADARYKDIIKKIRKVYSGKIFASSADSFGGIQNSANVTYTHDADGLYLEIPRPDSLYMQSVDMMRDAYEIIISNLVRAHASDAAHIILELRIPALSSTSTLRTAFDMYDFAEMKNQGVSANPMQQANEYDAVLSVLSQGTWFRGIGTQGYWFDDVIDPQYAEPLISMSASIRNTPAEAVWKKWIGSK